MTNFNQSLSKTILTFEQYLREKLEVILDADIFSIEKYAANNITKMLDSHSGIDALVLDHHSKRIRGLASRIQFKDKRNWRTFTIRKERESGAETEYEKRKESIKNNYLYPYWTLQAYFNEDTNQVLGFALAKTEDLINMIDKELCYEKETGEDQIGQSTFYVCKWDKVKDNGYFIYEE